MLKITALTLATVATVGLSASAQAPSPTAARPVQQPTPVAGAPASQPARVPEPAGQPLNITLELTITDQGGSGPATKKTVSMIVADRQNGSIRSTGRVGSGRNVTINVDARPLITKDNVVRLDLSLEYQPVVDDRSAAAASTATPSPVGFPPDPSYSNLNQRISVLLESGKALVISQAADPGSARQISVEVKATIAR
ncbi:MAG: hypothetical protein ABIX28_17870 [Vicinamibacterales bacterium]